MSTPVESRHLGRIVLNEQDPPCLINAEIRFAGVRVPVEVEIAFPDDFGDATVNDIDMVLDNLEFVDELARATITRGVDQIGSTAANLFKQWERKKPVGWENSTEHFVAGLTLCHLFIMPDGGKQLPDRVIGSYRSVDTAREGEVKVRFLEPAGPVLAPAGFSGPRAASV